MDGFVQRKRILQNPKSLLVDVSVIPTAEV